MIYSIPESSSGKHRNMAIYDVRALTIMPWNISKTIHNGRVGKLMLDKYWVGMGLSIKQGVCRTKISYTGSKNSNNDFQTAPPSGCSRTSIKGNFQAATWFFDLRYYSLSSHLYPWRNITSYFCLERIFPCWKFCGDIPNKVIQSNNSQNCHKSGLNIVEWN